MAVSTRTVAVMFTDMKGFTARTAKSSRADLVSLLQRHEQLVLPIAAGYGGTLVKTIGDAFLFVFDSPTNAVLAGVQIQERLRVYNHQATSPANRIELRIGINVGEVTIVDNDVYGDVVNVASRVEAVTEPLEIMVTQGVVLAMNREEVGKLLAHYELRLTDSGSHQLKGVQGEVRLYHIQSRSAAKRRPTAKLQTTTSANQAGAALFWWLGHKLTKVMVAFARTTCLLVMTAAMLLMVAAGLFESLWLALIALLLWIMALPWGLASRKLAKARLFAVVVLATLTQVIPDTLVHDLQFHTDALASRLGRGKTAAPTATFSFADKLSVYVLSVGMTVRAAARGEHVTATQTFYLLFPGAATRRWHSRHALGSCEARQLVGNFTRSLEEADSDQRSMKVALATNPSGDDTPLFATTRLAADAVRNAGDWVISVTATAPIVYRPGNHIQVLSAGGAVLTIDTGLLAMLQDSGWLYPYQAEYDWNVAGDDGRLFQGCGRLRTAHK